MEKNHYRPNWPCTTGIVTRYVNLNWHSGFTVGPPHESLEQTRLYGCEESQQDRLVYVSLILLLLKRKTAGEINPFDPYLRALSMSLEGCLTTERSLGGVMKSILNLCVGDSTRVMDDKEKKSCYPRFDSLQLLPTSGRARLPPAGDGENGQE